MPKLRLATRKSALALAQAQLAAQALATIDIEVELVPLVSAGDQITGSLAAVGGKDLFVNTLRQAIRNEQADLACHSLKDVGRQPDDFSLLAFLPRADARDCLVGATLPELQAMPQPVIGTSSPRRTAQLAALLPHADIQPLRGNVPTRLKALNHNYAAIVLACAGLERLGLTAQISQRLEINEFLPAPGQGTIVLEGPSYHQELAKLLAPISDAETATQAVAERACTHTLDGDCHTPLGAYAEIAPNGEVKLTCQLVHASGVATGHAVGTHAHDVGTQAAQTLLANGGDKILELIRTAS